MISDGLNKYSVPFDLIGKHVSIRTTRNLVEVFFQTERVAVHARAESPLRDPVVKPEHMPEEHRAYLKYTAEDFTAWGGKIGPNTGKTVSYFLNRGKAPEQGYKFCASLQNLAKKYGSSRLEAACAMLLSYTSSPDLRTLTSILKNGQDKAKPSQPEQVKTPSSTGITRGADYYRKLKGGV